MWPFFFNAKEFSSLYMESNGSITPCSHVRHERTGPSDPCVHGAGSVGYSSRWWYLHGMYTPEVSSCSFCAGECSGEAKLLRSMDPAGALVDKTRDLYRIPYAGESAQCATNCVRWPNYDGHNFDLQNAGVSMLDLTDKERFALNVVYLKTCVRSEQYGAGHQENFTKTGLSRASFRSKLVSAESLPTRRAVAAFEFLMKNRFYKALHAEHRSRLEKKESLNISSYDLFIVYTGTGDFDGSIQ